MTEPRDPIADAAPRDSSPAPARAASGVPDGLSRAMAGIGVAVGCTVYYLLSKAFGVTIEVFDGINTFTNPAWFAAVTVAPLASGFVTGVIARHNGKWLAMAPLLLLHPVDYFQAVASHRGVMLSFGIFVFLMIVMLELALMAGWAGELLRNRLAGRAVSA
ncbi:MAG: hypothetical protein OEW11_03000 [Nitrospirota bacterium]|nr:hypothetical protein [Nitrospirota bacterium]